MESESELPNAFSMWKVFYNTITVIFKNLENAEQNLKILANTILSSQELSNIFNPRYDPSLSVSQNQSNEKMYQTFTTWLFSRLYFLLSCEKFERVHDLFIEAQLKILDVLRLQQHVYDAMVAEYNSGLTELNDYLCKEHDEPITITLKKFLVDNSVIKSEDLDLTSKFIRIKSEKTCILLQQGTLKILTKACVGYIDRALLTDLSKSILSNIFNNLERSAPANKIIVLECYTNILHKSYFLFKKEVILKNHFRRVMECIYQNYVSSGNYFNLHESLKMEEVLCDMFDVIIEYKIFCDDSYISTVCQNICEAVIKNKLSLESLYSPNLLRKGMMLLKEILTYEKRLYHNAKHVTDYVLKTKDFTADILLKYQVLEELRRHIIKECDKTSDLSFNVQDISETWKLLHNKMELSLDFVINETNYMMMKEVLQFAESIMKIAQNTYICFYDWFYTNATQKLYQRYEILFVSINSMVNKLMKIQEMYNIDTSADKKECLDTIVSIFTVIISVNSISQAHRFELEQMICVISYPFLKDLNFVNPPGTTYNLISNDFNVDNLAAAQSKSLQHLSSAMINVSFADVRCFENLNSWILQVFKFCISTGNPALLCQVAQCTLRFVSTNRGLSEYFYEILTGLITINDIQVLQILSESLGTIICVLSGKYTVLPILEDEQINYNTLCLQCDFVKYANENKINNEEHKLYRKSDKKCFISCQFIIQKNYVQTNNYSMLLNLLRNEDVKMKRNIVKQLPRLLKHVIQLNTIPITKEWLNFMTDADKETRENFVQVIKLIIDNCQNNESLNNVYKKSMLETCLDKLKNASQIYLERSNNDLIESLLEVIKEIGCLPYPDVLFMTIRLLIFYVLLCQTNLFLTAVDHLNRIARAHSISAQNLYIKYKKECCKTLAEMTVYTYSRRGWSVFQSLERISLAFELTTKEIITRDCHHLLPYFVPLFIKVPESKKILFDLSSMMVIEPSDLFASYFPYIYPYVYLHENEEIFKQCMAYIQEVTRTHILALKRSNTKVIHSELLMNIFHKRDLVLKELYSLSQEESDSVMLKNTNSRMQIADYLQPRFLGVLVYFDTKLVSKNVAESIKKQILQSLPEIFKLMGPKNITTLRFKILAILRTALLLTEESYLELICNNWDAFIRCCEVESLGSLLSTIFVSILPLFELFPIKVNSIFKYLIIENEQKLKNHIEDLFFLSETNVSSELHDVLKKYVSARNGQSCRDQLEPFLKRINHENLEVRLYGLKYLKTFLKANHSKIKEMILGDNGMDPILVELIDVLIAGCRENDDKIRLASGQCIGELGAIEPSHFPRKYTQSVSTFIFYITDDDFVINALTELLRAFQLEKDTQNMNRFALAIQEILKAYGVSPDADTPKHNIWAAFPNHLQELMLPLLSSRYSIAPQSDSNLVHPICGSSAGTTFTNWLYNWISFLISLIKNDKKSLLQVCKPSLKSDYRTLMFFLPHILIHALLEGSDEDKALIYNEFIAVLNLCKSTRKIEQEQLKLFEVRADNKKGDGNDKNNYIKVIFILFDYLNRWLRECQCSIGPKISNTLSNTHYQIIRNFLELFSKLQIAQCNFQRCEYPRALLYLEEYVSHDKTKLNEQLGLFMKIYAKLEEYDGVAGAKAMQQTEPSIDDMILWHNMSGQLQNVVACYEKVAQERKLKPQYLQEMIRCYLELDNPFTAVCTAESSMATHPECEAMLYEAQVEPFWRLSRYDELSDLLAKPELKNNSSWGVRMGHALLNFRTGNRSKFQEEMNNMEKMLVDMLGMTSLEEGVYRHGYPHIINLHILNELQKAEETVYRIMKLNDKDLCEKIVDDLIEEWDSRLKIVQTSTRVVEPVLRLRRIILEQFPVVLGSRYENIRQNLNKHIAKYWLKSAEVARINEAFQQAYIYILKAEQYKPVELFIEKAKLYWKKEEQDSAFNTLKRGLEEHFPDAATFKDMEASIRKEDRKLCAEAKLLVATYNKDASNADIDEIITNYKEAVEIYREWEKSHVCLAQYYDRLFTVMSEEDKISKGKEIQIHIIHSFGKSLMYGSTYIYQSMPRMLSIWFDYGTQLVQTPSDKHTDEIRKNNLFTMTRLMDAFLDRLPAYMFLSAFSQLISRICHPVREVYLQIKSILIKLILKYPQQSMWMILSVSKSAYAMRTKRCQEVLQDTRLKNSNVMRLIYDFNRLAEKLIELCNKPINDGITTINVNNLIRSLPRLLQTKEFSQIMLPVQKLRKLVLPNPECHDPQHNPFPNRSVHIVGIEDEVHILQSLQRPRKITFRGSDGKKYVHMLKPKDDLRKDSRLMEFNDVVNLYLHRDSDARQRRLRIRTYSVVPLNEECGIVEWVDNLVGLRPILMKIYKQKGIYVGARELKSMMCNIRDSLARKRQVFEEKLLPKHPPVLSEWFKCKFPDVHCWYQARTAYIRTSAVMSMVGYILGLGDRHGENILFDSANGDTVHVDFNCLFNKGETFDWPERVPFRLTQNMVEAMGPLGVEGIFRKSCAVTLNVLRINTDTLMSIVKPFVYDPLVSWPRTHLLKADALEAERTNEQAVEHIRKIEQRLSGLTKSNGSIINWSLSCDGQANNLILEATSIDNLSQMYIGWGPYL